MKFGGYIISWLVAWAYLCAVFQRLCGGIANMGRERPMGFTSLIVQCHLASHSFISLSPCIVRDVAWVVRPCGVILNML